jgi:small subunit ribosomal protein S19
MTRSIWKGPYIDSKLFSEVQNDSTKIIYTYSRDSVIIPQCVGKVIYVHNGMTFYKIHITDQMVGRKLGEFILSKKRVVFKKKKNKKK